MDVLKLMLPLLTTQSNACLDFNTLQSVIIQNRRTLCEHDEGWSLFKSQSYANHFTKGIFSVFYVENCNTGNHLVILHE